MNKLPENQFNYKTIRDLCTPLAQARTPPMPELPVRTPVVK